MPETLGARLRERREQQGIAVSVIAERTKIKSCLLEALERDDVSRWPNGIFRRAYFRSYAEAIGIDADELLPEFLALHPDPHEAVEIDAEVARSTVDDLRAATAPPTRLGMMLNSALKMMSRLGRHQETAAAAASTPATGPVPSSAPSAADEGTFVPEFPAAPASPIDPFVPALVDPIADAVPEPPVATFAPDFLALSRVCPELGRAGSVDDVQSLLADAARILQAKGLIVWMPNGEPALQLAPVLAHGYSRRVLARLSPIAYDGDNPTAAAFRSARTVGVHDEAGGALVVPILGVDGCAGVLALELPCGHEQLDAVRAAAAVVAAMLVAWTGNDVPVDEGTGGSAVLPPETPLAAIEN